MIKLKRVYEPASPDDGVRILVERLWPRGIKKDALNLDTWLKNLAPSDGLRQWFGHDPKKWQEFQKHYFNELEQNSEAWKPLLDVAARSGNVTLLFTAKDQERNNAVALKSFLESKLKHWDRDVFTPEAIRKAG